jgi:diadenosine tetraphosphatase ApaH/serine/threonine PP2A family protein phosphatase
VPPLKYGILGDIHANLSALQTALSALERAQVDEVISVGDVVGYGAAPLACIQLLQERGVHVVKGNHDAACVGEQDDRYFNRYARDAIRWTRSQLDPTTLRWLRDLPLTLTLDHCQVAHGTLADPAGFEYLLGVQNARPSIRVMERPVCFVGHSHIPITIVEPMDAVGRLGFSPDTSIDLRDARRAIVNVGSVGQPRDEDPRLAVAIYDAGTGALVLERHEYDIDTEVRRIRAAGLPTVLGDRLWLGL